MRFESLADQFRYHFKCNDENEIHEPVLYNGSYWISMQYHRMVICAHSFRFDWKPTCKLYQNIQKPFHTVRTSIVPFKQISLQSMRDLKKKFQQRQSKENYGPCKRIMAYLMCIFLYGPGVCGRVIRHSDLDFKQLIALI